MQYFDIVLFAVLAGYLGIKLYRTLGLKTRTEEKLEPSSIKNDGSENEKNTRVEDKAYSNGEGIDYIKELNINFNENDFLLGANKAYEIIINAKNQGNKKQLISLLEDNVFRIFEKEILENEVSGNNIEVTKIIIKNSSIVDAKVSENITYITVNFKVDIGTIIKGSDNSVISDTTKKLQPIENIWIFSRPLNADNPNWKLFSV